jgi:serine protease Do
MAASLSGAFAELARGLRASTVRVHDASGRGYGAGIVWDAEGTILSNAHVVRGDRATIEWPDGRTLRAEVLRRDDARDLAALRVRDQADLVAAPVRSSASVVPGELAVAVGNPYGLQGVVTTGLVQRCNSRWVVADVRLAPGNSGGPLADAWGRIIGINAMVARGLALAIPSDAANAFLRGIGPENSRAA